jgi:hypothetical protein
MSPAELAEQLASEAGFITEVVRDDPGGTLVVQPDRHLAKLHALVDVVETCRREIDEAGPGRDVAQTVLDRLGAIYQ